MTEYIVDGAEPNSTVLKGITKNGYEHEKWLPVREEIVRCRDCEHVWYRSNWQPDKRFEPRDYWICEAEWCEGFEGEHPEVRPDGYCAWGSRRDA